MNIIILKETPGWIALSKPAGIQVERNPFDVSIESFVYKHLELKRRHPYVGIIHRLDRVTTGLVLVAKRKSVLKQLNEQFREKEVRKTYLALVEKSPSPPEGALHHWLEKDKANKRSIAHDQPTGNAAESMLSYRTIGTDDAGRALLEVKPTTGRYHQIRVQLASMGCPVAGDTHYGAQEALAPYTIALHAWKLEFFDPGRKRRLEVVAPPPDWAQTQG